MRKNQKNSKKMGKRKGGGNVAAKREEAASISSREMSLDAEGKDTITKDEIDVTIRKDEL